MKWSTLNFVLWLKKYSQTARRFRKILPSPLEKYFGNPVPTQWVPLGTSQGQNDFSNCVCLFEKSLRTLCGTTHQLTNWVKTDKFCPKFKNCTWLHGTRSQFRMCRQIQICLENITGVRISVLKYLIGWLNVNRHNYYKTYFGEDHGHGTDISMGQTPPPTPLKRHKIVAPPPGVKILIHVCYNSCFFCGPLL